MNSNFPRIITLLRKERGLSQKQAASDLQISQALLSHYEKGIRECGLAFLVRAADFYQVSCDYLLGRTPHRAGGVLKAEDLPETPAPVPENVESGETQSSLHKKVLTNSVHVLFGLLHTYENEPLTNEATLFLEAAIYKLFRALYLANPKNPDGLFAFPGPAADGFSTAAMSISAANFQELLLAEYAGAAPKKPSQKGSVTALSPEVLSLEYPVFSEALFRLIREVETRMNDCQAGR